MCDGEGVGKWQRQGWQRRGAPRGGGDDGGAAGQGRVIEPGWRGRCRQLDRRQRRWHGGDGGALTRLTTLMVTICKFPRPVQGQRL